MPTERSPRFHKFFLVALGVLLLAAWYSFQSMYRPPLIGEIAVHAYSAQHSSFRMVTVTEEADTLHPPLLTFALWVLFKLGIFAHHGIKVVFIVGRTLTTIFLYRFLSDTFGKAAAGYALLFWLTLPVFNSAILGNETHVLFLLFLVLTVSTVRKLLFSPSLRLTTSAMFGIFGGLAYLSRQEGLSYFVLFFLGTVLWKWYEQRRFPSVMGIAALCFAAFLFLHLFAMRLHLGHWSGGSVIVENLRIHPLRFSLFQGEILSPESIWGDQPPSLISAFVLRPDLMAERIIVNFRNLLLMLGALKGMPLYLWPFLGVGMLGPAAWRDEKRALLNGILMLGCLPTLTYLLFHLEERYLAPIGVFLLVWLGVGLKETREALASAFRSFPNVFSRFFVLVLALMASVPLAVTLSNEVLSQNVANQRAIEAALWIRENSRPDAAMFTAGSLGLREASRPDAAMLTDGSPGMFPMGTMCAAYAARPILLQRSAELMLDEGTLMDFVRKTPRAASRELFFLLEEAALSGKGKTLLERTGEGWEQVAAFGHGRQRVLVFRHDPIPLSQP